MKSDKNEHGKVQQNKKKKEKMLFSAAYELFTTKGTNNTAIDDIVKKAGVAKGTFYLYFKDKYDIIDRLILDKSTKLINEAVNEMSKVGLEDFKEKTLFFINYVITYFKQNKLMLKLINKNFSSGLFKRAATNADDHAHAEIQEVFKLFIGNLVDSGMDKKEAEIALFMVFELVGIVCYSTIILQEPKDIDEIKPILFKNILKIMEI